MATPEDWTAARRRLSLLVDFCTDVGIAVAVGISDGQQTATEQAGTDEIRQDVILRIAGIEADIETVQNGGGA